MEVSREATARPWKGPILDRLRVQLPARHGRRIGKR